ncbi:MAG: polymer-forming cytoskeletal protein [Acidiferrobacterales bacterium]|nr:polymer-forming cytoskeletal protein [Acidiferrobacterales bacterium]
MFKKVSDSKVEPSSQPPVPPQRPGPETKVRSVSPPVAKPSSAKLTTLSEHSSVIGEVTGDADVSIYGKFDGTITIPNNTITVESSGLVQANLNAKKIVVHGAIKGNLFGSDTVHVLATGVVEGDIKSMNVILEKACTFNGSIQMLSEAPTPQIRPKPPEKKVKAESSPTPEVKPITITPDRKSGSDTK